jgi:hypothetical protein
MIGMRSSVFRLQLLVGLHLVGIGNKRLGGVGGVGHNAGDLLGNALAGGLGLLGGGLGGGLGLFDNL